MAIRRLGLLLLFAAGIAMIWAVTRPSNDFSGLADAIESFPAFAPEVPAIESVTETDFAAFQEAFCGSGTVDTCYQAWLTGVVVNHFPEMVPPELMVGDPGFNIGVGQEYMNRAMSQLNFTGEGLVAVNSIKVFGPKLSVAAGELLFERDSQLEGVALELEELLDDRAPSPQVVDLFLESILGTIFADGTLYIQLGNALDDGVGIPTVSKERLFAEAKMLFLAHAFSPADPTFAEELRATGERDFETLRQIMNDLIDVPLITVDLYDAAQIDRILYPLSLLVHDPNKRSALLSEYNALGWTSPIMMGFRAYAVMVSEASHHYGQVVGNPQPFFNFLAEVRVNPN